MTNIQWTDETWNPISGCTRVSEGCDKCYAVTMTHRLEAMGQSKYAGLTVLNPKGNRHFNGQVRCHEDALAIPLRWMKPRRIFVNSMSDLFHKDVPFEFIDKVFAVMALCPQHTFQILTKRPERMAEYLRQPQKVGLISALGILWMQTHGRPISAEEATAIKLPLFNVWLGTSVENQKAADERIPHLLECPAAVRFLSVEPLLGPVTLPEDFLAPDFAEDDPRHTKRLVIVGGESGPGARPMHPDWVRPLRDQCQDFGTPFFFKQWGEYQPLSTTAGRQELPFGKYVLPSGDSKGFGFLKKGKKAAGRLLDGREWNEMPEVKR